MGRELYRSAKAAFRGDLLYIPKELLEYGWSIHNKRLQNLEKQKEDQRLAILEKQEQVKETEELSQRLKQAQKTLK